MPQIFVNDKDKNDDEMKMKSKWNSVYSLILLLIHFIHQNIYRYLFSFSYKQKHDLISNSLERQEKRRRRDADMI